MRILHLSTSVTGGAGLAARRSSAALNSVGVKSTFLGRFPKKNNPHETEHKLKLKNNQRIASSALTILQSKFIQNSQELFTPLSLNLVSVSHPIIQESDLIHIHSNYNLISSSQILHLSQIGKPVAITLHDQRLITGGCHYSRNCNNFKSGCINCPQCTKPFKLLPQIMLRRDSENLAKIDNLQIITPSTWLKNYAEETGRFESNKISKIHNAIPGSFSVGSEIAASRKWGVPRGQLVIAFIATNLNNPFKGFHVFKQIINKLESEDLDFYTLLIGSGEVSNFSPGVRIIRAEPADEEELADLLAITNIVVVPSEEDNSPNVIGEALMAGATVIGTNVGGIPELLNFDPSYLFEKNDLARPVELIKGHLNNMNRKRVIQEAEKKFGYKNIANELKSLYLGMLDVG
jgi:glycosyltransferase involved in cell wall biosynthesis